MEKLLLKNGYLSTYSSNSDKILDLLIENGVIIDISNSELNIDHCKVIDLNGRMVIPGLIDLHIHGAGGAEVFNGDLTEINIMTSTLLKYGVSGITPTVVVNPENDYLQLRKLNDCLNNYQGQMRIFGLHLEGPFVNPIRKGGIPANLLRLYNKAELLKIIKILGKNLKMITIAPEISPNMEIIDILLDHDIIPALGHTNIDYEETHKAFDRGINHVTHVFNAMPSLHHRNPGPLLAILERDDISVQIIADGYHLNPAVVAYLYNQLGIDKCICVSDGQSVIGLPDGEYNINGGIYLKNGEKATDKADNLIGTALDVGSIANKFQNYCNCTYPEALKTITQNPAEALGLGDLYSSVEIGKIADLVVLGEDKQVEIVFVEGECIQKSEISR